MDRYEAIKKKLLEIAKEDNNIKAIAAIGSSTRETVKADEYSDLDIVIATEDTDGWLYGEMPKRLGEIKISFIGTTITGEKERRVLYENALDVDMLVLTPNQLETSIKQHEAEFVCNRGYTVLYDDMNVKKMLDTYVNREVKHTSLNEEEFINLVNDFYFHTIWASKKILRGELWASKMCIDCCLKEHLLQVIEMYSVDRYHVDVWHGGRFLDRWVEDDIKQELRRCFAHYDREDMVTALFATMKLFSRLSEAVAQMEGYEYPAIAKEYAEQTVTSYFDSVKD